MCAAGRQAYRCKQLASSATWIANGARFPSGKYGPHALDCCDPAWSRAISPDRPSRIYKVTFVEGVRVAALRGPHGRWLRNLAGPNGRLEPGHPDPAS